MPTYPRTKHYQKYHYGKPHAGLISKINPYGQQAPIQKDTGAYNIFFVVLGVIGVILLLIIWGMCRNYFKKPKALLPNWNKLNRPRPPHWIPNLHVSPVPTSTQAQISTPVQTVTSVPPNPQVPAPPQLITVPVTTPMTASAPPQDDPSQPPGSSTNDDDYQTADEESLPGDDTDYESIPDESSDKEKKQVESEE